MAFRELDSVLSVDKASKNLLTRIDWDWAPEVSFVAISRDNIMAYPC